jgi:hypothetical protein
MLSELHNTGYILKKEMSMGYNIRLIKIPVKDVNVSAMYYKEHLGFEVAFIAEEYGWAQLVNGNFEMSLYEPGKGGGNGTIGGSLDFHLSLDALTFDDISKKLLTAGVLSENMIHSGNDGSTFIDLLDPDKNILKIMKV